MELSKRLLAVVCTGLLVLGAAACDGEADTGADTGTPAGTGTTDTGEGAPPEGGVGDDGETDGTDL